MREIAPGGAFTVGLLFLAGGGMDLKFDLMRRIAWVAALCLVTALVYVLLEADRHSRAEAGQLAEAIARQLTVQRMRITAGFDRVERFPDWDVLVDAALASHPADLCVRYVLANGEIAKSICHGENPFLAAAPDWFAWIYQRVFLSQREVSRSVVDRGKVHGQVLITLGTGAPIAEAWRDVRTLGGLSAYIALAIVLMVYVTITKALRPTQEILAGMERIARGDLGCRLPPYRIAEWRRMGEGLNRLATSLEQSLGAQTTLMRRLIGVQEEERRAIARELHDEFGQCLSAIQALTASIDHRARKACPDLQAEAGQIAAIASHMMECLRGLLLRLRPAELDERGLIGALHSLIGAWNGRLREKTRFSLAIHGDLADLPGSLNENIYRIVQEGLTNAAKHAGARTVQVEIARVARKGSGAPQDPKDIVLPPETAAQETDWIEIQILDDGIAAATALEIAPGLGLLGMRERIATLGGQLRIVRRQPSGLAVAVALPLSAPPAQGQAEAEAEAGA
jgi:signal transduction histidine kinase